MNKPKIGRDILKYNYLLRLLVSKNIKSQYYRSILGVLWTVLNPLLNMLVMAFVFGEIFGRNSTGGLDFPVYLMSASIIFGFMSQGSQNGLDCLVNQSGMLQKTKVPMWVFPTSNVLSALVSFGFSLISLLIVMLVRIPNGVTFHLEMFMLVVMLPSLVMFTLGLSFILSSIYVFFRDMKHIYGVILTLWRFLTPIFYPISAIKSEKVLFVMHMNPMFHYVEYFRTILLNSIPSLQTHLICYGFGIGMLIVGLFVQKLTKNRIISRL